MIRPRKAGLGKVHRLSKYKQAIAAELLEQLAQIEAEHYRLSSDERMIVREALDRSTQGGFADAAEIDAILRRPWG